MRRSSVAGRAGARGERRRLIVALGDQVARLEAEVRHLAQRHAELHASIHGPPWEGSMRQRVHEIREAAATDHTALTALTQAQQLLQNAQQERRRANAEAWGWRWRWVGLVLAIATVLTPYVMLAIAGHA